MSSVDFDVIRIVEHGLTGRRNVSHEGAEGDMQGLYTAENLSRWGRRSLRFCTSNLELGIGSSSLDLILHRGERSTRWRGEPIVRW